MSICDNKPLASDIRAALKNVRNLHHAFAEAMAKTLIDSDVAINDLDQIGSVHAGMAEPTLEQQRAFAMARRFGVKVNAGRVDVDELNEKMAGKDVQTRLWLKAALASAGAID